MKPIVYPKYYIGIVIYQANLELVKLLEPWCDKLYLDDQMQVLFSSYYEEEHKNTTYDLTKRVFDLTWVQPDTEVIVEVHRHTFTQQDYTVIQQLSQILNNEGEEGVFQIGNLTIRIDQLKQYQNNLIRL
jgi:hypothetical protein